MRAWGFRAAYTPTLEGDDELLAGYARAAEDAGLVIAEVGIWRNVIAPDAAARRESIADAERLLDVADKLHARCAVTFAGTLGEGRYGVGEGNFAPETYTLIVDTVRAIIDAVRPTRTRLALECMPTTFPDSGEGYAQLLRDVDRERFGVHFDPVNLIVSPRAYAEHRAMIRGFVDLLGPHILSCHAKDVVLGPEPVAHLDEALPGRGGLDYGVLLTALDRLDDLPVMTEHLESEAEYREAADHLRAEAARVGVRLEP